MASSQAAAVSAPTGAVRRIGAAHSRSSVVHPPLEQHVLHQCDGGEQQQAGPRSAPPHRRVSQNLKPTS